MKTITIENKQYEVATTLDDITLGQYVALSQILARREWKVIGKLALSDEVLKDLVEVGKESEEFKLEKVIDMLCTVSDIDKDLFVNYPSLVEIVEPLVDWSGIFNDKTPIIQEIEVYEQKFKVIRPSLAEFQRWCDFENFVSDNPLIAFVVYLDNGTQYNRYHPDFDTKMMMFSRMEAKGNAALLDYILDEVHQIRDSYKFVYGTTGDDEDGEPAGASITEHHNRFKWEDVIVSIAETNMFTSDRGNLYAVRNANTLDVLDYLNIKRSRELAEYKDARARERKNKSLNK